MQKFKCPQCGVEDETAGMCPTCNVEKVAVEAADAPEGAAEAPEGAAEAEGEEAAQ